MEQDWTKELRAISRSRDDSGLPVYRRMIDCVSRMISDGRLPDGMHLPPDTAVAARIGTSHITWAKVLNELRSRGMVERSRQRGTFIRRPMRRAKSGGVGEVVTVFMDDINTRHINADFMDTIQYKLAEAGFRTAFVSAAESRRMQYAQLTAAMRDPECRGGIVWSLLDDGQISAALRERPADWPLVFLAGDHSATEEPAYDLIRHDWARAGSELAERFVADGGQSFTCLVCGRHLAWSGLTLIRAIEGKLVEHGLPPENLAVVRGDDAAALEELLSARRDDSLLIAFDLAEIALLKELAKRRKFPLEQLSPAVGFFKSGVSSRHAWELPMYRFDTAEMALAAVESLLDRLNGDGSEYRRILIPGRFDGNGGNW